MKVITMPNKSTPSKHPHILSLLADLKRANLAAGNLAVTMGRLQIFCGDQSPADDHEFDRIKNLINRMGEQLSALEATFDVPGVWNVFNNVNDLRVVELGGVTGQSYADLTYGVAAGIWVTLALVLDPDRALPVVPDRPETITCANQDLAANWEKVWKCFSGKNKIDTEILQDRLIKEFKRAEEILWK